MCFKFDTFKDFFESILLKKSTSLFKYETYVKDRIVEYKCKDCNKIIYPNSIRCQKCHHKYRIGKPRRKKLVLPLGIEPKTKI